MYILKEFLGAANGACFIRLRFEGIVTRLKAFNRKDRREDAEDAEKITKMAYSVFSALFFANFAVKGLRRWGSHSKSAPGTDRLCGCETAALLYD